MTKMKRVKNRYENDLMLYVNLATTLKEYFKQYKTITYKRNPTNYTMLVNEKRHEIEQILERLRKALDVISITDFVDLK